MLGRNQSHHSFLFWFIISLQHCLQQTSIIPVAIASIMKPLNARVVTYNVLSDSLCSPKSYPTLNPEHLDPAVRLPSVLERIGDEVKHKSIICLQEVTYNWAGSLHTYFANQGYNMITGLYGRKFNGYMGIAIAIPTSKMEILDVNICRLSDQREGGWPRPPEDETDGLGKVINNILSFAKKPLIKIGILSTPPIEPWSYSENRVNMLLQVKLRDRDTQRPFCLGNYHMPCTFYCPPVMTIHSDMAARVLQSYAENLPYILAGDWNIKPQDSMYKLLTCGTMDKEDPAYPPPRYGVEWTPSLEPMQSAYAVVEGKEPDFTNFAAPRNIGDEGFCDTLDYIFCGSDWKVKSVKKLPHRDEAGGPFPNNIEPSDHVLLAAELQHDG
jgi:2',5'-phosphodiesterase